MKSILQCRHKRVHACTDRKIRVNRYRIPLRKNHDLIKYQTIAGYMITHQFDLLHGNTVRSRRGGALRLLKQAHAAGSRDVHNIRYEFSRVGDTTKGDAELLAYGTAVL